VYFFHVPRALSFSDSRAEVDLTTS